MHMREIKKEIVTEISWEKLSSGMKYRSFLRPCDALDSIHLDARSYIFGAPISNPEKKNFFSYKRWRRK